MCLIRNNAGVTCLSAAGALELLLELLSDVTPELLSDVTPELLSDVAL